MKWLFLERTQHEAQLQVGAGLEEVNKMAVPGGLISVREILFIGHVDPKTAQSSQSSI